MGNCQLELLHFAYVIFLEKKYFKKEPILNMNHFNYKKYRILSNINEDKAKIIFDCLLFKNYKSISEYKNDKNSFVSKIEIENFGKAIIKIPRNRNKRFWEKFLTLFRDSDAFRSLKSLEKINAIGLHSPTPILAAQKREFGMVVDSFFVYEFLEGKEASDTDLPKVLDSLRAMHEKGYIRNDPKLKNFIIQKDKIYFIDLRLKKLIFLKKLRTIENLCKFTHAEPKAVDLLDEHLKQSTLYRIALLISNIKVNQKRVKRAVKSKIKDFRRL